MNTTNARIPGMMSYSNRQRIRIMAKRHLQLDYRNRRLTTTWLGFWQFVNNLMGHYRKPFVGLYKRIFYITSIIPYWWDTCGKEMCTTLCKGNNICQKRQIKFILLWEIVWNGSKTGLLRSEKVLKLILPSSLLECVAMDIMGALPKMIDDNQFEMVVIVLFENFAMVVSMSMTTDWHNAPLFTYHQKLLLGILTHDLTDNGSHFFSRFFELQWAFFGTKHRTTTAYLLQNIKIVEHCNKTIVTRLQHYVADHQRDRDIYVQPMTFT